MTDFINWIQQALDYVAGMPSLMLVFVGCVAIGYVLKLSPWFPNSAIPLVVILSGLILNLMLCGAKPDTMVAIVWKTRHAVVGMIIGLMAWMFHLLILKRIEPYLPTLVSKIPGLGWLTPTDNPDNSTTKDPKKP